MKALVIDDSTAARFLLTKILRELGFQCIEAVDGKQALERLAAEPDVDLALVDWNMPVMNGYELLLEMRNNRAYDSTRVMMATTETEMHQVVKAIEAGANEYIMKPFTKEMVEDKLRLLGFSLG